MDFSLDKVEILDATVNDVEGINNVIYKSWLVTYPNEEFGITKEDIVRSFKYSFTPEKIEKQKNEILSTTIDGGKAGKRKLLIAKINNLIIGVCAMIENENDYQLRTIYVLPEYTGKGVGKKMWNVMIGFFDKNKDITVQVVTYNLDTIEFYKKLGFVDTGKRWSDSKWGIEGSPSLPEMELVLRAETNHIVA